MANSTAFAWRLASDTRLVQRGNMDATSPHDTAKGIAYETRSEPPPSLASLAVGSTP